MIRVFDVYNNIGIENVYREELWLIRFKDKPGDPLEADFFETEPPVSVSRQRSGAVKLIASSQTVIFPSPPTSAIELPAGGPCSAYERGTLRARLPWNSRAIVPRLHYWPQLRCSAI